MSNVQVRGYNNLRNMTLDLLLFQPLVGHNDICRALPAPLEFTTAEKSYGITEPTYRWDLDTAQAIFQELWNAGCRPADGSCGSEERQALKKHIDFAEHVSKALLDTNIHRLAGDIARSMK